MVALIVAAALAALPMQGQPQGQSQGHGEEPRAVVQHALEAAQGDSLEPVARRWVLRLRRDSADRAARLGAASAARFAYDYRTSERHYVQLAGGRDRYALWAMLGHAQSLHMRGRIKEATSWYERAVADARALGDSAAGATALLAVSGIRGRTTGLASARATLDSGAAMIPAGNLTLQGELRCRRAAMTADREQAMRDAAEGADMALRAGAPRHLAACLAARAQQWVRAGVADSAGPLLARAAAIQRSARDLEGLAVNLQWHAYLLHSVGNFGRAWRLAHEAVQAGEKSGNFSPVAWALFNLSTIARDVYDLNASSAFLARAEPLLESHGDQVGLASLNGYKGDLALARGDAGEARRLYGKQIAHARRFNFADVERSARFGIMLAAIRQRDWVAARRELDSARAYDLRSGRQGWAAGLRRQQAVIDIGQGHLDSAELALRGYVDDLHPSQHQFRADARMRLAEVYLRRGDLLRAAVEFIAASDALDEWRATLGDRDLRVQAFQHNPLLPPPPVAALVAGLAAGGRAEDAFRLAERRRARDLLDEMLRATEFGDSTSSAAVSAAARAAAARALTSAEVVAALPDTATALLEYVTGRGGQPSALFVITRRGGMRAYALAPMDSLANDVGRLVSTIESGRDARAIGARLGAALLGAAAADLPGGIRRLVVVPDDVLHRLPFDALVLDGGRWVAERFAVSVTPSAAVAVELWGRPVAAPDAPTRLAALGDPAFDQRAGANGAAEAGGPLLRGEGPEAPGALVRLPASGREARLVARYASDADVLVGTEASEAWLKRAPLDDYQVLHFATHAFVDEWSVARTALVLAPGGGEDGIVGPADLESLRLNADLVVLSACRTAGGVLVSGEGVRGLTSPLLRAGARSVVATAWKVGDQSTVTFVDAFYRALAAGAPASDALRSAKLDAIARGRPAREWAAFTLVGDPMARVALRGKS